MKPKASKGAGGFYARRDEMVDAAIFDDRLSRSSIRVFSAIKRHWRPDNLTAWPGRGLIAQIAKCDERTVSRAIAELKRHGYIIVKRGGMKGDRYVMPEAFENSDNSVVISDDGNSDKNVVISGGNSDIAEPKFRQNDAAPIYEETEVETEGAKAPPAPMPPMSFSSLSTVDSENGEKIGDDPDFSPFDDGPKEDDEPIIVPPDEPRPLPEIPATIESEWREAEEHLPPPDPRYPDDDPDHLAEVENLTGDDAAAFVDAWAQGFIGGDAGCAAIALTTVKRASRLTMQAFPSSPDAVAEFLIAPLLQHLSQIAEGRVYGPEAVDTALEEFRAAVETLPDAETTERKAAHG